jgi:hypothetical protein
VYDVPPEMLQTTVSRFVNERNTARLGIHVNVLSFRPVPPQNL